MAEQQKSFADYIKDLMGVLPTVNGNPMMSVTSQTDAAKYRENPFYMQDAIRKRIAAEEAAKQGKVAGGGLFGSMPSTGGDSANQENQRNYYQDLEDRYTELNISEDGMSPEEARAAAQTSVAKEQAARNERFAAGLNLFANAFLPGVGLFNAAKYGAALPDYLQGNARVMVGDTSGHQSPYTPKPAGVAAPVVSGQTNYNTYTPDSVSYSAPGYTSAGSDGDSLSNTPDSPTTGTGADVTYGDTSWGTYF